MDRSSRRRHLLLLLLLSIHNQSTHRLILHAAHARKRISTTSSRPSDPNTYDRSITTWSEDGRLLQVEYAMEAASRGSTVACMLCDWPSPNNSTNRKIAVLAMVRETKRGIRHVSFQKKYWTVEEHKIHRIDTHAILITTGLSGDGLALAKTLRRIALNHRLSFGEASLEGYKVENMTARYHVNRSGGLGGPASLVTLARDCASLQNELTRTSGARPLGVQAILLGLDPMHPSHCFDDRNVMNPGMIRLFQSESGGILEEYQYCSAGRGAYHARAAMEILWKELQEGLSKNDWREDAQNDAHFNRMKIWIKNMGRLALISDRQSFDIKSNMEEDDDDDDDDDDDQKGKTVDLYVLRTDITSRGNLQILCARDVVENELDMVSNRFVQLCH